MIAIIIITVGVIFFKKSRNTLKPEEVFNQYIYYTNEREYEKMYELLTANSKSSISQDDFIKRNKNIYDGIDMLNMKINITNTEKLSNTDTELYYDLTMSTSAGEVSFSNKVKMVKDSNKHYLIEWSSNLIFPDLNDSDKIRIKTLSAQRGNILDRNENILAGKGMVSSIGLVPGKMNENKENDISRISELLNISEESINKSLNASYVKEDTFVELKKVSKDSQQLKDALLQIPGIKITNAESRVYTYNEATSHLIGYVQNITAEELKNNPDKGYSSNSIIGKAGLEKIYEDRLKGTDGVEVYIEDSEGKKKKTIAKTDLKNGEDIKLTIDANIQQKLYNELKSDKGFFVVMQPKTGEILALVSTPSYNANDFILGMSNEKWNSLKNDENKPMYTRYLQAWCPGSTFKPVTGAIGLSTNKLSINDEFNYNSLSWQKDASWGNYKITTLTAYNGAKNLKNAIIHSDNIYFANAVLQIGSNTFEEQLKKIGFNEDLGFELSVTKSQFANNDKISTEIQLADSGYGQGQILINPIHMASIYSAFINDGNMIKPYLEYKSEKQVEYLKEGAFTKEASNTIKEYLIQVVENEEGTAHDAKVPGLTIAGKTGTAELKQSKEESNGSTLGWFNCFTITDDVDKQLLIIGMVEDANTNGGSHYIIKKIKAIL